MHEQLVEALVRSENEAADDLLLEGLRVGAEVEQAVVLKALLARKTSRGLSGVVEMYESLGERLQFHILANIRVFHGALRECGRSPRTEVRLAAMKLIALSRQGKLAYVLSENLHDSDDDLSTAAAGAIVSLAQWVNDTTLKLQLEFKSPEVGDAELAPVYRELVEQRTEIEVAVARAIDVHRGKQTQELLRAVLLLSDGPRSKTLAILHTAKHGGQSLMVRRLQQAPAAEHVAAFLLGASHGQLRTHFGNVFSHIKEKSSLDALLQKTHWLKDHQLQLCMHQVNRGTWWQEGDLLHDIHQRPPLEACQIAEWLGVSGMHDIMQDDRFARLAEHAGQDTAGRLRLLRIAIRRKKGSSVQLLRAMLTDADERLMRMAARDIVRRRPTDFENILLQLMTNAPDSVRRVVSRSLGAAGFENYWNRFDRLDRATRKQAGKAMLKLLPDCIQRLARRLNAGPNDQRIKAMQITHELEVAEQLREVLITLASHAHPKVRSKAVSVLGELPSGTVDTLLERVLHDSDPRVRANAIEAMEVRPSAQLAPLLVERAKASHNRERANAIKALFKMKVGNVGPQLQAMLKDERAEHRISAMWALKQIGWWKLLREVGHLAKDDTNHRVRRYAMAVLRGVAEMVNAARQKERVA